MIRNQLIFIRLLDYGATLLCHLTVWVRSQLDYYVVKLQQDQKKEEPFIKVNLTILILYAAEEVSFEHSIMGKTIYQVRDEITLFINVASFIRSYL